MLISDWLLNFKINLVALLIGCQRVNSVTLGRVNSRPFWERPFWERPLWDDTTVIIAPAVRSHARLAYTNGTIRSSQSYGVNPLTANQRRN